MNPRFYAGEFMTSPFPVHLDGNFCSHACVYCFANLNQPNRRHEASEIVATMKRIDAGNPSKIADVLMANGHSALASNTVDPFAKSNVHLFREYFRALDKRNVKVGYQTKGGDEEFLQERISMPPSTWYVSITGYDTKAFEPGAPVYEQRIELLKTLVDNGHFVIAGINPFHNDFYQGGTVRLIDDVLKSGVRHAWIEDIHLSNTQKQNMRGKAAEAAKNIDKEKSGIYEFRDDLIDAGFNVMFSGDTSSAGFWDGHYANNKFYPTMDSWRKHLDSMRGGKPIIFSIDKICKYFTPQELEGRQSVFQELVLHFGRAARNLEKKDGKNRRAHYAPRTVREVFEAFWCIADYNSPMRYARFALASGDNGNILTCDDGFDLFVYDGSIQDEVTHTIQDDYVLYI